MAALRVLVLSALSAAALARPHDRPRAWVTRQVSKLRDSYDFIIAGGGTAGLTVADRLTEAFPNKTVLVIEYGKIEDAPGEYEPPDSAPFAGTWDLSSLPIPALNNRTADLTIGKTVGGSSAVNGQFFDRGSRYDYDAWRAVGSPEFDNSTDKWDWDGLFPFFKKSVTLVEPSADVTKAYGYTWNSSAYGNSTPIYAVYPPFQFADQQLVWKAINAWGVPTSPECAGGDKAGLCWVPTSEDPVTAARSFARIGHYDAVKASRPNYDLLVEHQVTRLLFPKDLKDAPPTVEIKSLTDGTVTTAKATVEVILSTGAIHTPHILQKSGIGPAALLKEAGIDVVVDLPGVGYNFQDHCGPTMTFALTNDTSLPSQSSIASDSAIGAAALAQYKMRPAQGPYTLAMGNSAIYIPLINVTSSASALLLASALRAQAAVRGAVSAADLKLPAGSSPEVVKGYMAQLSALANLMVNTRAPYLESPFMTGAPGVAFLLHPASRGSVLLDVKDPLGAEHPVLDYRTASHVADTQVMRNFVKYFRKMYAESAGLKALGGVEMAPLKNATTDSAIDAYVRDNVIASFEHPCCTAAMLPLNKGGVVNTELLVYGAPGGRLRVVDTSIFPLIPGTHTSATTYAVAEKAADIIIRKWS